jgi:anti-anti-sigma regulatory factor
MKIELERRGDCQIIRLADDLRFWKQPEQEGKLLVAFGAALEGPPREVVLNLLEVLSIDSRGIATLVRLPIRCAQRNIGLKVVMPRGVPREAIKHIHIFDPWPKFEDESSALGNPPQ